MKNASGTTHSVIRPLMLNNVSITLGNMESIFLLKTMLNLFRFGHSVQSEFPGCYKKKSKLQELTVTIINNT